MDANKVQAMNLASKVRVIMDEVVSGHIQRHDVVLTTWLSLVSGRPAFFLGPPGVDKTGTVNAMLQRIAGATFREELMPTLATGDQLLVEGTVLREDPQDDGSKLIAPVDRLGGAATVDVFFADEVWKTEDGVLKVLFDLFNLDAVRYAGQVVENSLKTFLAASNELPDPEGKLYALWSRMTLRVVVDPLDQAGKKALVASRLKRYRELVAVQEQSSTQLTLEEVDLLRQARPFVEVSDDIVDIVLEIIQQLMDDESQDFSWLWADDRRFGRIFDVLQAHALLQGRDTVNKSDLVVLQWLLWDEPEQVPVVSAAIAPFTRTALVDAQELIDSLLSTGGTVQLALEGDRQKGVEALTQCESAENELKRLKGEASGQSMSDEIELLIMELEQTKRKIIAVVTGQTA